MAKRTLNTQRVVLSALGTGFLASSIPFLSFALPSINSLGAGSSLATLVRVFLAFAFLLAASGFALLLRKRMALIPIAFVVVVSGVRWVANIHYVFPSQTGRALKWQGVVEVWATQQFLMFVFAVIAFAFALVATRDENAL